MMSGIGLEIVGVSKRFSAPGGVVVEALRDVSFRVGPSEFIAIVGPNGSGKSTLLNLIGGTEQPDRGRVTARIDGREFDWSAGARRSKHVARIHQDPTLGSADELTVLEHIQLARMTRPPIPFLPALGPRSRLHLIEDIGHDVLAAKSEALIRELSYGQRQLLALEMAAARAAGIFLLDEPTASLDRANAVACMQRVEHLRRELQTTVFFVTHDMALAAQFGDRLIVLRDGRLHADVAGDEKRALGPEDVFRLAGFDKVGPVEEPAL